MAARVVVITEIGGAFFFGLLKPQRTGADGNAVTVLERMFEFLFAIHVDLVGAAVDLAVHVHAVNDHERAVITGLDVSVMPRRARIVKHYLIVRRPPDLARRFGYQIVLRLPAAGISNLQCSHTNLEVFRSVETLSFESSCSASDSTR